MAVWIIDMKSSLSLFYKILRVCLSLCFILFVFCEHSFAKDNAPRLNNGKKWRIAYYQGGSIPFYSYLQREIIKELMEKGWIEKSTLPEKALNAEPPYWNYLCDTASSKYLEFLPGNGYSASWNNEKRKKIRTELLRKLQNGEIDLIIAMGTWAGEDLVNDTHATPTLVMFAASFEKTGIIKSLYDSGFDHVNVQLDPSYSERQLRMYHRISDFKKLGVAYENTDEGIRYSNTDIIKTVANDLGFEVNRCEVLDTTDDREKSRASCLSCFQELAINSDAIYITPLLCADEDIEVLAELFKNKKVLSYSLFGSKHVEKGILLGVSAESSYELHGAHNAGNIIKVLSGAKPRSLPQVVEIPFFLSINTATAKDIGFEVPESIYKIARGIYDK